MLPFYEILAIGLMVTFIVSLFRATRWPGCWPACRCCSPPSGHRARQPVRLRHLLLTSWDKFSGIIDRFDAIMSNWVLVSLPMFVYMGLMLDRSGVADTMMRNFVKVFGGMRGGLGLTVIVIGILLAASTGIVGASVVLLAMLSMPIMMQHHYSKSIASGVVAASGTLGILIPPSIMLVLMADQVSVSVGDLFMGALVPGVAARACCTWSSSWWWVWCARTSCRARPHGAEKLTVRQIGIAVAVNRSHLRADPRGAGLDLLRHRHADRGLRPGRLRRHAAGRGQPQAELEGDPRGRHRDHH